MAISEISDVDSIIWGQCRSSVHAMLAQRRMCGVNFVALKGAADPRSKHTLSSKHNAELPLEHEGADKDFGQIWPLFLFLRLAIGLLALLAAYEMAQFILGACQGYSGVAAFERSIIGYHFGGWSIDPMACR